MQRLGGEADYFVAEDNNLHFGWRMARVGDLALLAKPADAQSSRRIDCFAAESGKTFKLDPERALFTLRYQHDKIPPDFELLLYQDSRQWFGAVALFDELDRRYPNLFDPLRAHVAFD